MKHLMRGVSLGLFDENAVQEKFDQWNAAHEELVAKREEAHRKSKQEKRHAATQESVRLVQEKQAAKAAAKQAENAPQDGAASAEEAPSTEVSE